MTIAKDPLFLSQFLNPALAGLIDSTAALLPGLTKQSGGHGGTTTTTNTKTTTAGGTTAKATANAGTGGAKGAGRALGMNVGEAVGEQLKGALSNFAKGFVEGFVEGLSSAFTPDAPNPADNCGCKEPGRIGSLKTDAASATVETAGGYKIAMTGQFEWTITGPDGSSSRIWGDPHMETKGKDGQIQEKWDFKKDSTFVLPDGTKINVKCVPWGNGDMTVTSQLEILHGNDRVVVTDIDKGKGKVGAAQQGVIEQFKTEQTFVAGKNVADWYFDGHQVLANLGGKADAFHTNRNDPVFDIITTAAHAVGVYGGEHGNGAGINRTWIEGKPLNTVHFQGEEQRKNALEGVLSQLLPLIGQLTELLKATQSHNAYKTPEPEPVKEQKPYDPNEHKKGLSSALRAIGSMFQALASLIEMVGALKTTRAPQTA